MKKTKMDVPAGIKLPGGQYVNVHITGPAEGTAGTLSVSWEVKSQLTKQVIDRAMRPRTHVYNPTTEPWDTAISVMVSRAIRAYYEECSTAHPAAAEAGRSATPYTDAVNSLTDNEKDALHPVTWGKGTWRKRWGFLRRICQALDAQHAAEHSGSLGVDVDVLNAVRDDLIAQTEKHGRTRSAESAAATVDRELKAAQYCLNALVECVNEQAGRLVLPPAEMVSTCALKTVSSGYEQAKWIPVSILARLVWICFRCIPNGLIMGIVLMLCLGLRTNEACAVRFGDIIWLNNGCVYGVRVQGAARVDPPKTPKAYRDVYGGQLLVFFLRKRMEYLRGCGYSDDEIRDMYVLCASDCPTQPLADGNILSAFARKALELAGYTAEDFLRATQLMKREPEYETDGKTPISSVEVYIFRRNAATMMVSICDLLPGSNAIDAYLGHESRYPRTADYANPSFLTNTLIPALERIVLSPEYTANPLYRPITLQDGIRDYKGYAAYRFVAEDDMDIEIEIESTEPVQTLTIRTTADITMRDIQREPGSSIDPAQRSVRPVILPPPMPDEFEVYLKEIDKIDFSELLPPTRD